MDQHGPAAPRPSLREGREDDPRARLQEEFEFAPDGQMVTDGHGLIQRANYAAAALLRCPKEFLAGKPLGLFVAEGHRARFYDCLSRLWRGAGSDQFETRLARRVEEPRDVAVWVVAAERAGESRASITFRWAFRDVTDLRRAEAERAELLRRVVTAQEDERRRVARELHDSFGQLLTALTLSVKAARSATPLPPATDAKLAEVQRVADELGRAAHDLAVRLRPTVLDDVGLDAALGQYVAEWSARTEVKVDYEAEAVESERLPRDVETAIFRVVQEALTNVARHARARRVSVVVGRHDGHATVAVEDDGVGFDPEDAAASGRLGLVGMRERVALAGGGLDVESSPGNGTTVLARFPPRDPPGGPA
jgi:signal transduction histidine kinase